MSVMLVDPPSVLDPVDGALDQAVDDLTVQRVGSLSAVPSDPVGLDCVVVSDTEGIDGVEAVRTLSDRFESVAVVAVSADPSGSFAPAARAAGADDVICLPADVDDRFAAVVADRLLHAAGLIDPFPDAETVLDDLLENLPHRLFVKNEAGRLVAVSESKAAHYGLDRDELVGLTDHELAPSVGTELRAEEREIMETGEPVVNKVERYVDNEGRHRWVSTTKAPRRNEDGEVVGIVGSTRDVTEQQRHEEMLNAVHTASRELVAAESCAEIVDAATDIPEEIPDMPAVIVGISNGEELSFQGVSPSGNECDRRCRPILKRAYETDAPVAMGGDAGGRHYETVDELDSPACVAFPLGEHGALGVVDTEGALDRSAIELSEVFARNVRTALDSAVRKERLADQSERLEEFAGIVSHDLQNPLSVAQGYLELLDTESDLVDEIDAALDRIDRMSDDLLTLAKDGQIVGAMEPEPLDAVAAEAWDMVETETATLDVDNVTGTVDADRDRLRELLENLFSNAAEHADTENGVTVTVGTLDDGFYVADDGQGIPDERKGDVFERGYTTGADGTGFGLRIVEVLADAHGWDIDLVDSEAGGARFEIRGV